MEHEGRCVGNRVNAYTSDMDFHGGSKLSKLTYPIKTIYSSEARKKLRLVLDDFQPDVCHLNNFNYQLTPSMIMEIVKWRKVTGHMPCNGTKDKEVMGNLNNQTWDELWNSPEAEKVRAKVRCCDRDCWMIGSVSPAMHKYIWKPATWVLVHKFKALFTKHPYSMYELKICRDYRDGKVTKEELDKCSTCDMNCVINNGLSEASKEQLKHKTGEEIVDADIAQQMETK